MEDYLQHYNQLSLKESELIECDLYDRPAFLINSISLAQNVLKLNNYSPPPVHPYLKLRDALTGAGKEILYLEPGKSQVNWNLLSHRLYTRLAGKIGIQIDIGEIIQEIVYSFSAEVLFGLKIDDWSSDFVSAIDKYQKIVAHRSPQELEMMPEYHRAVNKLNTFAQALTKKKSRVDQGWHILITLINAAHATSLIISWCLYELGRDTSLQTIIRDSQGSKSWIEMCMLETLRMYPPAWLIGRVAAKEHLLMDTIIPKDAYISICIYSLQRTVGLWKKPNEFMPARWARDEKKFANKLLAFGAGSRKCPASSFGFELGSYVVNELTMHGSFHSTHVSHPLGLIALEPDQSIKLEYTSL
ncbi:MAG: hypothetical protein Tsb0034_09790 [Ekhidna sp.]